MRQPLTDEQYGSLLLRLNAQAAQVIAYKQQVDELTQKVREQERALEQFQILIPQLTFRSKIDLTGESWSASRAAGDGGAPTACERA